MNYGIEAPVFSCQSLPAELYSLVMNPIANCFSKMITAFVVLAALGLLRAPSAGAQSPPQPQNPSPATSPATAPAAPPTISSDLAIAAQRVAQMEQTLADWPDLAKFREANAALPLPAASEKRVVFMGDSITEGWAKIYPQFFAAHPGYVDRGISGQTTPQMLVRFRQDVIAMRPAAVVILAGTNDIAGNTGPTTVEAIEDNLQSMAELARGSGIRVVLSSVLPVFDYAWRPGLQPVPKIAALNSWMKDYCEKEGCIYLDYFSAMADERKGMPPALSRDGVHPNKAGFVIMAALAENAIAEALAEK
jgi:lysophospholipase L1-like esterase